LYRPLQAEDGGGSDGKWESSNPVDPTTGLWYDPQPHGNNADWSDLIPTLLQHGYESSLGLKDLSANPLLMVERSYNPPPLRQQLLEILMEECQVPATFFGRDATLACYACARTTSTVIDIGYNGTTVTPVYEGYVEQKGIRRTPIGSLAMDELALEQLTALCGSGNGKGKDDYTALKPLYQVRNPKAQRHDAFHRLALLSIAKDCRESGAGQSINTAASKSLQVPSINFTLPDGQTVAIPSQNRFEVADLVFGRPLSALETKDKDGNNSNTNPREEALAAIQKQYQSLLLTASQTEEEEEMDDDDRMDDEDNDDRMDDDEK
jgi:actin-related protein